MVILAEKDYVVDKMKLTYEGLFSARELYNLITEWLEDRRYDKNEKKNYEAVEANGRYTEIWMEPWKTLTEYSKRFMRIRLIMSDVKDVEVDKDGVKVQMNQGKVHIVFDAWMQTDFENRWEGKPFYFFIRTAFNKYFFKPFTSSNMADIKADVNELYKRVSAYLNMQRYK